MQKTVCQDALEENFLHEEDEKDIFRRNVQIFHIVVSSIVESTFLILTKFSFRLFQTLLLFLRVSTYICPLSCRMQIFVINHLKYHQ